MLTFLQVHQVDTRHVQKRRAQGGSASPFGTLHSRAARQCAVQGRRPLPPCVDTVCKGRCLPATFHSVEAFPFYCASWEKCSAPSSARHNSLFGVMQADCLPEPRDVFTYLKVGDLQPFSHFFYSIFCIPQRSSSKSTLYVQEHNIGQVFCVYYVAYAAYLELRGSYAKADAVFRAGLQRWISTPQSHVISSHALKQDSSKPARRSQLTVWRCVQDGPPSRPPAQQV